MKRLNSRKNEQLPQEILKRNRLLLHYLDYANKAFASGFADIPALNCNTTVYPDYIALSGYPSDYHHTERTGVGFWEYDDVFDGKDSLWRAIYDGDEDRIKFFKKRYEGINFAFTPDTSQFGDIHRIENWHRLFRARIMGIWFAVEIGAVVIPTITFANIGDLDFALQGLEDCSVVAFSTKGFIRDKIERPILEEAVKRTIAKLKLKTIIVYDVCGDDFEVRKIFKSATDAGIRLVIPDNALKLRNTARKQGSNYTQN